MKANKEDIIKRLILKINPNETFIKSLDILKKQYLTIGNIELIINHKNFFVKTLETSIH